MPDIALSQHSGFKARLRRLARHARDPLSLPRLIWKNFAFAFSAQAAERRYDQQLGIDTAGYIETENLDLNPDAARRGMPYGATPPLIARFLIEEVAAKARGFTFVDVGSGKGRVLLIAAGFPFRQVVGFEHSQMLNAVAAANIRQFALAHPDAAPITLASGDAARLPLPDGPLVLFLFNSLGPEAVKDFAASLKTSYLQSPRKIICIYYNSAHPDAFEDIGIFPLRSQPDYPEDACDRYSELRFKALVFETPDP
jgi:SAM-dependent methyltransferase